MLDIILHIVASFLTGTVFWYIFDRRQWRKLFTYLSFAFLSGVLIDIDHVLDYYQTYGFHISLQHFLAADYFTTHNYILFHGYEYVLLLFICAFFVRSKTKRIYFLVLGTSMLLHLIIDIFIAQTSVLTYSLIYRALHGFRADISSCKIH